MDPDLGSLRRIFYSIVHQIDHYLDNQPGIHLSQNKLLITAYLDLPSVPVPIRMAHRLGNDLIHKLCRHPKIHPSVLNPCDRQQIFHQLDQPHGIIINVPIDLHPRLLAEFIFIGKQVAGISGNRGKRSAQIMGNGPKKVSPKLLLFNLHGRLGGLPGIFLHPGGQRTGNKGYQKHDAKGHRIAGVIGPQGKTRDCKQKIKGQYADHRGQKTVHPAACNNRYNQHTQDVHGDNIRLRDLKP